MKVSPVPPSLPGWSLDAQLGTGSPWGGGRRHPGVEDHLPELHRVLFKRSSPRK